MRNRLFGLLVICLCIFGCEPEKSNELAVDPLEVGIGFAQLLEDFYDGSMALDPLKATSNGDHRFNAEFPDYLSKSYKDSSIAFYKRFRKSPIYN